MQSGMASIPIPCTAFLPPPVREKFPFPKAADISLLADLLGHESIETTRIYLTRSSKEQKLLLDKMVTW